MTAEAQAWGKPSRRRVPRYPVQTPLDVTVLRSGIPDTLPGRSLNLCERGFAAVLAGELQMGETVGVEVWLPRAVDPLRTRALVRHQDKLRCGMEFVGLSPQQLAAIREWAAQAKVEQSKTEAEPAVSKWPVAETRKTEAPARVTPPPSVNPGPVPGPVPRKLRRGMWSVAFVVTALLLAVIGWRWRQGWQELETGLPTHEEAPVAKAKVQVAAEVMQKLIIHRVDPEYPAAARQSKLQGVIALDVVVDRDGSVVEARPLNGPDVLAQAAAEALRWWKFEPYRVNGEPTMVETTVAVEFKP
jgi:TonB family protein